MTQCRLNKSHALAALAPGTWKMAVVEAHAGARDSLHLKLGIERASVGPNSGTNLSQNSRVTCILPHSTNDLISSN